MAAKDNPKKKAWKKEVKWRRATEEGLGDVDLEEAMEDTETEQMTITTTVATASTSASMVQTTAEVYAKPYSTSAESRGERSSARQEKKETMEKQLKERQEKEINEKRRGCRKWRNNMRWWSEPCWKRKNGNNKKCYTK